jgi:hypothetical protein
MSGKKLIIFGDDWEITECQYFSTAGHMKGLTLQEKSIGEQERNVQQIVYLVTHN